MRWYNIIYYLRRFYREAEDGTVEYVWLYNQCAHFVADLDNAADESSKRRLELTIRHATMKNVSRHVHPRSHDDRRTQQKLPVFLYNSMPESKIIDEYKHKVLS